MVASKLPRPTSEEPSFSVLDRTTDRKLGAVAFSHDGELVAWGADKEIKVAHVYTEKLRWRAETESNVRALEFSQDGELLVAGEEGAARVHAVSDGHRVRDLDLVMPDLAARTVAISCSNTLAVGTEMGDVLVRPLRDPAALRRWRATFLDPLDGVPKLPRGGAAFCNLTSVAFSHDGSLIATGSQDHAVRIWSVLNGERLREFTDFDRYVNSVAFSPDGRDLAVASQRGEAKVIPMVDDHLGCSFIATGPVRGVAYSPSGAWLATSVDAHDENFVAIRHPPRFPVGMGKEPLFQTEFLRHKSPVTAVAVSPKGDRIVTASEDETVRLWRICWLAQAEVKFTTPDPAQLKALLERSGRNVILKTSVGGADRYFSGKAVEVLEGDNARILTLPWRAAARKSDIPISAQILLGLESGDWNGAAHTTASEGIAPVTTNEAVLQVEYRGDSGAPTLSATVRFQFFQGEDKAR